MAFATILTIVSVIVHVRGSRTDDCRLARNGKKNSVPRVRNWPGTSVCYLYPFPCVCVFVCELCATVSWHGSVQITTPKFSSVSIVKFQFNSSIPRGISSRSPSGVCMSPRAWYSPPQLHYRSYFFICSPSTRERIERVEFTWCCRKTRQMKRRVTFAGFPRLGVSPIEISFGFNE